MISKKYRSIVLLTRKRLSEVKSEKEIELINSVLDRVARFEKAEAGDVDEIIKLSKEIIGTEND